MTRPPPGQRPSARDLADLSSGKNPVQISGKPADVCPYCGAGMFATGTRAGEQVKFRYVKCRNQKCGRAFYSRQPPATIIREVGAGEDESSSSGLAGLTIHREVG